MIDLDKYFNSDGDTLEQFLSKNGIHITIDISNNGKGLIKCDTKEDELKGKHKTGFYAINANATALFARCGDFRVTDNKGIQFIGFTKKSNETERRNASEKLTKAIEKTNIEAEIQKANNRARTLSIYEKARQASGEHAYIKAKRINVYPDVKELTPEEIKANGYDIQAFLGNVLLLPMYNNGEIDGVQYVFEKRDKNGNNKRNASGCSMGTYQFGEDSPTVFIGEGFATCASFYEATGYTTIWAFNKNGLKPTAQKLKAKNKEVYVIEDNDINGDGQKGAESCLPFAKGIIHIPQLINQTTNALISTDANDIVCSEPTKQEGLARLKDIVDYELEQAEIEYEQRIQDSLSDCEIIDETDFIKDLKATDWWIEDWIPQKQQVAIIFGDSAVGKSYIVTDLMLSIANGYDWHNHEVEQGKVLYLCGEGQDAEQERIALWYQYHGLQSCGNLKILPKPKILDSTTIDKIKRDLELLNFKPNLIVIDTVKQHMNGDENSAKDVSMFLTQCEVLKQTFNAFVMAVHHSGKGNTKDTRGSSAFKGNVDRRYIVEKSDKGIISLAEEKVRNGKGGHLIKFKLEEHAIDGLFNKKGIQQTNAVLVQTDASLDRAKELGMTDRKIEQLQTYCNAIMHEDGQGGYYLDKEELRKYMKEKEQLDAKDVSNRLTATSNHFIGYLYKKGTITNLWHWDEPRKARAYIDKMLARDIIDQQKAELAKTYQPHLNL